MFAIFYSFVVAQRLAELFIAKKNERWMIENGALEYGKEHYPIMVLMHVCFLILFLFEVMLFKKTIHPLWPIIAGLFIGVQVLRCWAIQSLGRYWNTKILIVPGAAIINRGPYRYMRHPNYLVVGMEIILIPLLFQAYTTAFFFTFLNTWMLSVRIPVEEKALIETARNYSDYAEAKNRFTPKIEKNID